MRGAAFIATESQFCATGKPKNTMTTNIRNVIRQTHLYLGLFIAPAVLFFAFTGLLQTLSLHESSKDGTYQPARWIVVLAQIHKKQTLQVPVRKAQPAPQVSGDVSAQKKKTEAIPVSDRRSHNTLLLKIFFSVVCLGLFTSTFSGLYMSFRHSRNRRTLAVTLAAGIVVPIVLTMM